MMPIKVRSKLLDHPTELMVSAANLASLESIATTMVPTLAVNPQVEQEMDLVIFSLKERINKCLLTAQVPETKNLAELVQTRPILT